MKRNILLYGPEVGYLKASYGGGTGGYTRNMVTYLNSFNSSEFSLVPCFHTVRSGSFSFKNNFFSRFFIDTFKFLLAIFNSNPVIVHVLAQYRSAIPREFMVCLVCKVFNIYHVYEIKAGQFDTWYSSTNSLNKFLVRFIIKNSSDILVEGERYIPFIKKMFNKGSVYWPNFVPSCEIPINTHNPVRNEIFKICFIGYCYRGKGIFELVEGLQKLDGKYKFELHIVGHESQEFKDFLNGVKLNYKLVRHGKLNHSEVLEVLANSNLFCLPTKHSGEGHNNSINEAMMLNVPIMCTKHGFLFDLLKDDKAFFIENLDCLNDSFEEYLKLNEQVDEMVANASKFFNENLHSDIVIPKLNSIYNSRVN